MHFHGSLKRRFVNLPLWQGNSGICLLQRIVVMNRNPQTTHGDTDSLCIFCFPPTSASCCFVVIVSFTCTHLFFFLKEATSVFLRKGYGMRLLRTSHPHSPWIQLLPSVKHHVLLMNRGIVSTVLQAAPFKTHLRWLPACFSAIPLACVGEAVVIMNMWRGCLGFGWSPY